MAFFFHQSRIHLVFAHALRFCRHDVHAHFARHVFHAFVFNQNAFGCQSAVNVSHQIISRFNHLEAANRHIFAQLGNHRFALFFNQRAQLFNRSRFFLGSRFGYKVSKRHKTRVFGNKVCFAVHFNQSAHVAFDRKSQHAFRCSAAGQFTRFRTRFNTQDFFRFFHVAFRFNQGFFAFHHAQAGSRAQIRNHFCSNFCHEFLQSL